jgi:hypothetical protein
MQFVLRCPVAGPLFVQMSILAQLLLVEAPRAPLGSYTVALDPYLGTGDAKSGLVRTSTQLMQLALRIVVLTMPTCEGGRSSAAARRGSVRGASLGHRFWHSACRKLCMCI